MVPTNYKFNTTTYILTQNKTHMPSLHPTPPHNQMSFSLLLLLSLGKLFQFLNPHSSSPLCVGIGVSFSSHFLYIISSSLLLLFRANNIAFPLQLYKPCLSLSLFFLCSLHIFIYILALFFGLAPSSFISC